MNVRSLAHNLAWRGLAVLGAAALYVILIARPELDTSISAPVQYQNMPGSLEMSAEAPQRIYLEVQGPSPRLRSFDPAGAAVIFNLASVQAPGEYTFTVESSRIDLPVGLKLVRAIPSQVRLRFERRIEADVPVRVRFADAPPSGYQVRRAAAAPGTLRIAGPESRVRRIGHVETDPVSLAQVVGRSQFRVHVFVADSQVRFVSTPEVQVEVSLEKAVQGGVPSNEGSKAVRD
jgi:hypothetical protein